MLSSDANFVKDGFVTLDGGMDAGWDPTLLEQNQYAFGGNISVRGGFPRTRPGWQFQPLQFDSQATQDGFYGGVFQGAVAYTSSDQTLNGILVSIGGRLFRVWVSRNFLVTEITPRVAVQVTENFNVPGAGNPITVYVTTETPFAAGQVIFISQGNYTISTVQADQLNLVYHGSSGVSTVSAGTGIQDANGDPVYAVLSNLSGTDFLWMFQAENYALAVSPGQSTVIFDGSSTRLADTTNNELPSGWIGVYGWGRVWLAQVDQRSFIASDLIGDPSGSPALQYVDAILKVTENNLLNGGGAFTIPVNFGSITALQVLAQLDTSLGIGPILVGTEGGVFSVQAPTDRTTWQNLTYPIQSVALNGYGPVGPRQAVMVNSDMWFRSTDGVRSFIAARREDQGSQGNTPQSNEMSPIFDADETSLLIYGSAIAFDNRIYFTVSPYRTDPSIGIGVAHRGVAVLNLDAISTLQAKDPPIWESLYTGLNILQLVSLNVSGGNRGFAFAVAADGQIDLWEISREDDEVFYDESLTTVAGRERLVYTPVFAWLESRSMNFGDPTQLKRLYTAEIYLDELVDEVTLVVYFKPDQYPNWVKWATIPICATVSQCVIDGSDCSVWLENRSQYAARIMLPGPPETLNAITQKPIDRFFEERFRFEITGHARLRKFLPHAQVEQMENAGPEPPTAATCTTVTACPDNWFSFNAYGP